MMSDLVLKEASWVDEGGIKFEAIPVPHESRLYIRKSQPDRDRILEHNKQIRENAIAGQCEFGQPELRIPQLDYDNLCKKYPVLVIGTAEDKRKFYLRFLKSSESRPYRLR